MYRSRFTESLDKNTLNYLSSVSEDKEISFYDILGSEAHTLMLYEKKIISKNEARKILSSLEKLKRENLDNKSNCEDIHELVESLIIKKIGKEIGGKMHTARSRNDQISLDIRLKIRDDVNNICYRITDVIETLILVAEKNNLAVMPLYTHLQQAQIGFFSHYLLAYCDSLFRDLDRLESLYIRVNESPLGAGPVGGTSLPIDRKSTAKMLGFKSLVENSIDATSSRDFAAEYVGDIAILMTNLSRIAEDFIIWSTSEFSFIELSDRFTSTSSVMPQKKNPDILEITRGKTAQVIGLQMSILSNIKGLPSGYVRDLQEIKPMIWLASKIAISSLIVNSSMLKTIKVNKRKMRAAIDSGYSISLDIAEILVKKGISFRIAHQIVGQLVMICSSTQKPLSSISSNEIRKTLGSYKIDPKVILKSIQSIDANSSLESRKSLGSSGRLEQIRMIQERKKKVLGSKIKIDRRSGDLKKALINLTSKIRILTK